jgi:DNA primase
VKVRLARIPDGKDPSDFLGRASAADFSDVLNRAVEALEFKWLKTLERFRIDSSDVRRREAVLDFMHVVGDAVNTAAVDAIQRGLLVNQVAHLLRIESDEVSRLMTGSRSSRGDHAATENKREVSQRSAAPRDAEQAVWTHLLEVLLNAPGLLSMVDPGLELTRIAVGSRRRCSTPGGTGGRFHSPTYSPGATIRPTPSE